MPNHVQCRSIWYQQQQQMTNFVCVMCRCAASLSGAASRNISLAGCVIVITTRTCSIHPLWTIELTWEPESE